MLLRNRVQPDAVDGKSGHTALYMAADTNRVRIAEILLSYGANVLIASYSGCSPVQAASSKSFHEMVKLLVKHGGCSDPERSSDSKDSSEFGKEMISVILCYSLLKVIAANLVKKLDKNNLKTAVT